VSDGPFNSATAPSRTNGGAQPPRLGAPAFPGLERAEHTLPPLHTPGAWTTARDRWERLATQIVIPAAPEQIWSALTEPEQLRLWLAVCHGSLAQEQQDCMLDFEDGEFFLCHSLAIEPPHRLQYLWRWLGIGQATLVTWQIEPQGGATQVTVTEEAFNPPWDWQTWNGGGWPGILDQLAAFLRTGTEWRWPWRRVGPYAQIELGVPFYDAWQRLTSDGGLRFWLQVTEGALAVGENLTILMGDASGSITMTTHEITPPGQALPSFLPAITYTLSRPIWQSAVGGRLWLEPAGWGRSLFQAVHYNWENLPPALQLSERKILTSFWAGAARRASQLCGGGPAAIGPHSWS
jgi:uncharacterized protein YndB with AHSA1/START domain